MEIELKVNFSSIKECKLKVLVMINSSSCINVREHFKINGLIHIKKTLSRSDHVKNHFGWDDGGTSGRYHCLASSTDGGVNYCHKFIALFLCNDFIRFELFWIKLLSDLRSSIFVN